MKQLSLAADPFTTPPSEMLSVAAQSVVSGDLGAVSVVEILDSTGPFSAVVIRTADAHMMLIFAVYHVTEKGWTKVRGDDVGELHYQYYPDPTKHPCSGDQEALLNP